MVPLTWFPMPSVKVASGWRSDLDDGVLGGVWLGPTAQVRVFKVNSTYANLGEIHFGNILLRKDDSFTVKIRRDGGVEVIVAETNADGASGSTSQPAVYLVPGVFPPSAVPTSNGVDSLLRAVVKEFFAGLRDLAARLWARIP